MSKISLNYPDTGLIISISVKNRDTGVEAFTGTMTEVGTTGVYKYDFQEAIETDYVYTATVTGYDNMSGTLYRDGGGLTLEQAHDLKYAGSGSNTHAIQKIVEKAKDEIIEKIDEIPEPKEIDLSLIDIAKEQIIDTIKSTENEICKDIEEVNKELKEDNVSTRQLVRQKAKKQEEFIQKQLDSEAKTQEMIERESEELEEQFEKIYEEEADMLEKQMEEQFENEVQEIENGIELNNQNNGN